MNGDPGLLARLEHLLARPAPPLGEVHRLAPASDLELLFALALGRAMRRGPRGGPPSPGTVLATAQGLAAGGDLPLAALGALRATLEEAGARLGEAGAWNPERPLWWQPLPAATPAEAAWSELDRHGAVTLPDRRRLSAAFAGERAGCWLALPALLHAGYVTALWRELEAAHEAGCLPLEREGVGAAGRRVAARSDAVLYLTGDEPALAAAAPRLAALAQWLPRRLGEHLAEALPGAGLAPPQTAMLARYPAPSAGYHPHLDNPGGAHDNGRRLTFVLYLGGAGGEPVGGEIALWAPGERVSAPPAAVLPPRGGSAVLFDSRTVAHQVRPLAPGPARWALSLWFQQRPAAAPMRPRPSAPTLTDLLLPLPQPPLPEGTLLFHELDGDDPRGAIVVRRRGTGRPRSGLVTTTYASGTALDAWCEHHLALGFDHLVVVFDHLDEPAEAVAADRLRRRVSSDRLTVWDGAEVAARRWAELPRDRHTAALLAAARDAGAAYAVAARQTLNASAALAAARRGELGGAPLDWLLHLDADELFHPEGDGRGGSGLREHLAAAETAGLKLLRYVNHELLLPWRPGTSPRFKLNPRLAAARLGTAGWSRLVTFLGMGQADARPWFHGYHNGKSAVAVRAAAAAGGVHGWFLSTPGAAAKSRFLAGPSVLHFRFASAAAFRRKYLAMAAAPERPDEDRLFAASPAEESAVAALRRLRAEGADEEAVRRRLDGLYRDLTCFSPSDVELLVEAGLLLTPDLGPLPVEPLE